MTRLRIDRPLRHGRLVRRYKRFLADVTLDDEPHTVHCANSGSMMGLAHPGIPVVVSDSQDPKRKLRHTLEFVQVDDGGGRTWVGVNTARPNQIVHTAAQAGLLPGVPRDAPLRREVRYGTNSRVDLLAEPAARPPVWIEVKNTTLAATGPDGVLEARFPDAVTVRGQKHMRELADRASAGDDALVVFLVNRGDCARFRPAHEIDPDYAARLAEAREAGVRTLPLVVRTTVRRTANGVHAANRVVGPLPVVGSE